MDTAVHWGLGEERARAVLAEAAARQAAADGGAEAARQRLSRPEIASDVLLAAACRAGVPEALEAFRRTYGGLFAALARSYRARDADELAADAMAAAWERLDRYHGLSRLRTWLNVVVRRWLVDRARAAPSPAAEWTAEQAEHLPSPEPETDRSLACVEFSRHLDEATRAALQGLQEHHRTLLRLRFLEEVPLEPLRHRPEIYEAGEAVVPVYGLTRRVQRVCRDLRKGVAGWLARQGYPTDDLADMLERCESVARDLAERLARALQIPAAGPS